MAQSGVEAKTLLDGILHAELLQEFSCHPVSPIESQGSTQVFFGSRFIPLPVLQLTKSTVRICAR